MVSKAKHSLREMPASIPCALGMIAGILMAIPGPPLMVSVLALFGAVVLLILVLSPVVARLDRFLSPLRLLVFVLLGAGLAGLSGSREEHKQLNPGLYELNGSVIMAEVLRGGRQRIRFEAAGPMENDWPDGQFRLVVPSELADLAPGDHLIIEARLQPPLPQLLPGGFDFTAHAMAQGYVGTGFVREIHQHERGRARLFAGFRHRLQQKIYSAIEPVEASVASALLVGLRGGIEPGLRETFRASGLAHLLAISGLHMVLFCGGVLVVVRAGLALMPVWSSRFPSLKIAAATALPIGALYLFMAGAPVSAVRAFGMMCLMILGLLISRRGITLHHVAVVAMIILAVHPQSLFEPAFQMSFAAVFALVGGWMHLQRYSISPPRTGWIRLVTRPLWYVAGVMVASILASGASAPFVLHHFGVTTAWSILGNVLGMPLMAFVIMPAGALALLLAPTGLEVLPLRVMWQGIEALVDIARFTEGLPLSRISITPTPGMVLVLFTAAMVLVVAGMGRLRALAVPILALALGIWVLAPVPDIAFTMIYGRPHAVIVTRSDEALASRKNMNSFAQSVMLQPFAMTEARYIPASKESDCRSGYCLIPTRHGTITGIVWRRHAMAEACEAADIIISHVAEEKPCAASRLVVTPEELERDGGMLVRIEEDRLVARRVNTGG